MPRNRQPGLPIPLIAAVMLALAAAAPQLFGQSPQTCTVEFPVNVLTKDLRSVGGISAGSFFVKADDKPLPIRSTMDDGSRRILLLVDNGSDLTDAARRIEVASLTNILDHARPQDQFALVTARGNPIELSFGTDRKAISAAVVTLADKQESVRRADGVLDEMMHALSWFDTTRLGDAIFVFAFKPDENRRANYETTFQALAQRRIRVFSLMLGSFSFPIGSMSATLVDLPTNVQAPLHLRNPIPYDIATVSSDSSGLSLAEPTKRESYNLTDDRLKTLISDSWHLYWAMTSMYWLTASIPPKLQGKRAQVLISKSIAAQVPGAFVLYPAALPSCAP